MTVAQARGVTDAVIYMAPRGYGPLTTTRALSVARSASLRAQSVYLTEKTGGTFPLRFRCPTTMKSWQLIAVVGDALQVRHMSGGEKGK